ncbi:MAG TPA: alpha-hydroxy-acid oxidizing protein [Blastococcus sp.]|nr:alpha-hydroxy-acid oxidizing protein [Blastococcus sp.]
MRYRRADVVTRTAASAAVQTWRALCLSARAVLIGRAYLRALAANGQAGVENILNIMWMVVDSALLGMGRPLGPGPQA